MATCRRSVLGCTRNVCDPGRQPRVGGEGMALDHEAAVTAPSLLTALPDTVVVADATGRIAYVNPAVRVLLGYDPEAVLGQPLEVLMPERFRGGHGADFSRF